MLPNIRAMVSSLFLMSEEATTMARPSNKYVTYTREFANGKIGVFYALAQPFMVNGSVNGGAIKFADLKMKRQTPSGKLIGRGIDFTVRVLGTGSIAEAQALKSSIVELLSNKIASTKILNAA
tara:strand:- start:1671 stop:2039 length:369 start_codon:yes stop_codon:yes gene_type:complete